MSTNSNDNTGHAGFADPNAGLGEFNRIAFVVQQVLAKLHTCLPVKVVAVTGGGLAPVGYVDILPLVQQLGADGTPTDHGIICNVPYFRLQGGSNAVIIDPVVNDIGMACFASRDISVFKNARGKSRPGSARKHDMSDALYIGGVLNGTPTQYIQFSASGVKIYSPTLVEIDAPQVNVNATTSATVTTPTAAINATTSAAVTAPSITLGANGQTLHSLVNDTFQAIFNAHVHSGVTTGGGNSGAPTTTLGSGQLTSTAKVG